MKKTGKILWATAGFLCFGLGTVGIVLPILPTVPFYLATLFCFTKSSERLRIWFVGTAFYRKHLESFRKNGTMSIGTKVKTVITVTIIMGIGFFCMKRVPVARGILVAVWVAHLYYFLFRVKSGKREATEGCVTEDVTTEKTGFGDKPNRTQAETLCASRRSIE